MPVVYSPLSPYTGPLPKAWGGEIFKEGEDVLFVSFDPVMWLATKNFSDMSVRFGINSIYLVFRLLGPEPNTCASCIHVADYAINLNRQATFIGAIEYSKIFPR